ncbi:MAG TPA: NAD(P)/FAD-dependent oxidoreductase [Casimicrobiaceae bacterium]|nr:NAD(P)/FAD-dependent oxidoreductase [Casimicrobiaceae bacterium]
MKRREFLKAAAAAGAASAVAGCATTPGGPSAGRVVVVGGGYGGATAAKYIRTWSDGRVDVTLVEANPAFVSCPLSNLVLGGSKAIGDITVPYDALARNHGVRVVHDTATEVDPEKRTVRLASGTLLPYDRLVLSPGIDFMFDQVPGLNGGPAQEQVLHAWKAGPQTVALRRQLEAMPDGGVFAIAIPVAPYRCPPGPYERACQVAWYFKRAKPKSKVLILDGNPDVTSKGALFKRAWAEEFKGLVEYRNNHVLTDVDAKTRTAKFETADDVKADVLNFIPPQSAGDIARQAGVITANNRWCEVDFTTFESVKVRNVHVLGDAIQIAPAMPKSGHMANQHAKVCAAAIVALLTGRTVNATPVVTNTCYSFVTDRDVMHVASVHQYDRDKKTFVAVPGAGGLSPTWTPLEGEYAFSWAKNIWADMLA